MGAGAKPTDSDPSLLPKEVGARLRQIRLKAGLTQAEVASRMGRPGSSGKSYVCQIERGYMPGLTFNAVMDFLSACGVDATAIVDIVDAYTKRPTIPEERTSKQVAEAAVDLPLLRQSRVVWYDRFNRPKAGRRETTEQQHDRRVRQAIGVARAIRWERRLHRAWNDVLCELHVGAKDTLAVHLWNYSKKVFGVLRRTRKTRPVWRDKAMARLDSWPSEHELPPEPFVLMKQAVVTLFAEMERKGELD